MFGHDFGFGNLFKKKTAKLLKYYSAVVALTSFVILIWPLEVFGQHQILFWFITSECAANFYTLKTSKYTVYYLIFDVHNAESIDVLEKEIFGVIMSSYVLGIFIVKVFLTAIKCIFGYNDVYCT